MNTPVLSPIMVLPLKAGALPDGEGDGVTHEQHGAKWDKRKYEIRAFREQIRDGTRNKQGQDRLSERSVNRPAFSI